MSTARLGSGLKLSPAAQMRCGDSTTAAVRALGLEIALASMKQGLRGAIEWEAGKQIGTAADPTFTLELTIDDVFGDLKRALNAYVMNGQPPILTLSHCVRTSAHDTTYLRSIADRLATKLGVRKADVDNLWPAVAPKAPGAGS
ncbi:MAG: hypothetical protein ABJE95_27530 [Byssovorax sp.]